MEGREFGNPSTSTEMDDRHLQQLVNLVVGFLYSNSIHIVIGIVRHFGHGNYHRMRETVLLGFHL